MAQSTLALNAMDLVTVYHPPWMGTTIPGSAREAVRVRFGIPGYCPPNSVLADYSTNQASAP